MRVIFNSVIVCHCRRVNHRRILEAISEGARDVDEVGAVCGAGTGCGGCRDAIEELVSGPPDAESASAAVERTSSCGYRAA